MKKKDTILDALGPNRIELKKNALINRRAAIPIRGRSQLPICLCDIAHVILTFV